MDEYEPTVERKIAEEIGEKYQQRETYYNRYSVGFSPDQTKIFSCGENEVKLIDLEKVELEKVFKGHTSYIWNASFSSRGDFIVSASPDNTARIWNCDPSSSSTTHSSCFKHEKSCWGACFFKTERFVTKFVSCDQSVFLWDIEKGKKILNFEPNEGDVCHVLTLANCDHTIISSDNKIRIWDSRNGKTIKLIEGGGGWIYSTQFNTRTFNLVSGRTDGQIGVHDFRTFKLLQNIEDIHKSQKIHTTTIYSVDIHPFGKHIISGSSDKTFKIYDLEKKKVFFVSKDEHSRPVYNVQFSPRDGLKFLAGGWGVDIWNFPLGKFFRVDDVERDEDEEERISYLIDKDLSKGEEEESDGFEKNVIEVKLGSFQSTFCFKFLLTL